MHKRLLAQYLIFNNRSDPGLTSVGVDNYTFTSIHYFGFSLVNNRFANGSVKLPTVCL